MAVLGLIRTIHLIGIELAGTNSFKPDVPHVTGAVARKIQLHHPGGRGIVGGIKQLQPNPTGMPAEDAEVHASATGIGPQGQRHTHANIRSLADLCQIFMQQAFGCRQIGG
ncbi:MAG: hypothetical protein OEV27_12385 [Nitrospira sp.]|nr:hypothetical protein [Nitrospira sp.]MDH4251976.1 hypothetical protein [Nitrospira sp.]MDH5337308.1 hypothetical protein [Nitrospira sp.]